MKTILVDANEGITVNGKLYIPMYEMLEIFPNRKIILTNASDDQLPTYGLDNVPYEVFSLKHNPEKVDPNYYKKMLNHFGFKADDVICFDHIVEVVASAKSVGIKTYFYDPIKKDISELKNFLTKGL